ncbi:MAG: type 1 glutamine amidotransferase, partial [Myxococcota bacterium]|nr:type 1 glutamine amidotransferase [Myxococcota bacterium]
MAEHERECFARALECPVEGITPWDLLQGPPDKAAVEGSDLLLVGGSGSFSTLDELPWIRKFFDFITSTVIPGEIPTFASCFGFQAIIRAGGGTMVRDPSRAEVGTYTISLSAEGLKDPLLGGLGPSFAAQLGHKDHATSLPAGTQLLASSERSPFQALRVDGTQILGTQFHPELDQEANIYRYEAYRAAYRGSAADDDDEVLDRMLPSPGATSLLPTWAAQVLA